MNSLKSRFYKKCGIYKIICIVNNKIYVGSSCNIYIRWTSHIKELNKNNHDNPKLQNAYNKYKRKNFTLELIEECDKSRLIEREQYYFDTLQPFGNKGYNINKIASAGPYMGKAITLLSPTGELCSAPSAHAFVEKYNLPHKAIVSICKLHNKKKKTYLGWCHPDNPLPIRKLKGPDGKIYNIIQTRKHAKKYNISETCLCLVLKGKQKEHKGWQLP